MAIIFELTALCASIPERDAFVRHFDALEHRLVTTKRTIRWVARADTLYTPFAITGRVPGLSKWGVRTVKDALEVTECGLRFYDHLRSAPPFRYAIAGWESGNIPPDEIVEWLTPDEPGVIYPWQGSTYVVDAQLFAEIGEPAGWKPFREGHWWVPYHGELYRPLGSSDHPELMKLQQQLFPELFRQ
jgi:hypothetical protein